MGDYEDQLRVEANSWVTPDVGVEDKLLRERMRHPKMIRDLLLDRLPTYRFDVMEVGGGPLPLSDLLPFKTRMVVDPCSDEYRKIAPCPDHIEAQIEDDPYLTDSQDLIIATNSLDHVESPSKALTVMDSYLRHGGYMAILCAENNAVTHPHPSHAVNLTVADIHRQLDEKYETVHELTFARDGYRYGWFPFEGACGQPAFAWLGRKAIA